MTNIQIQRGHHVNGAFYIDTLIDVDPKDPDTGYSERKLYDTEAERDAAYEKLLVKHGVMTYSQRYAALELSDKLYQFAEQYGLPESWRDGMYSRAKLAAKKSKGINIDEA